MKFSGKIFLYFIILLISSTVIALAGIYGFQRLDPSIDLLNSYNTQSLYYTEQMLTSISAQKDLNNFVINLNNAKQNITQDNEKEILDNITQNYIPAFKGNEKSEERTIDLISDYARINRLELEQAGIRAKKLRSIGIWTILFPTVFIWLIGIALLKRLDRTYIKPIQELNDVIFEYNKGNHMRRCPSVTATKDLQMLYDGINKILDDK